ncbi:MAG: hypothetical protein GX259_09895 [Bacteroidales bacterium]|jgi:hypothetical protein|nr:hypothetical protein [Bacteroidales bacterium]
MSKCYYKFALIFCVFFISLNLFSQNVGINTENPDSSAVLELKSSNQGFLPPRLTTAERDAIVSPAEGLIIYNKTEKCINYYNGANWLSLCGSGTGLGAEITSQPNNATVCESADTSFSVVANNAVSYQWQVNKGVEWENITSAGSSPTFGGYNTNTLTLTGVVSANNSWLFRCVVTGNNPPPSVSNTASLTVLTVPAQTSAISGPIVVCPQDTLISSSVENFNTDIVLHGSNQPSTVWFAPDYYSPIDYSTTKGCPGGSVGYQGSWNNYWTNFLRLPEQNCTGHDSVVLKLDVSHSYFASHTNDWCRFYIWADGEYKHVVTSIKINGVDCTSDLGLNGKGFKFTEVRNCASVEVNFDISTISNKSNLLFYIAPFCGYNDSNLFSIWFDNIAIYGTSGGTDTYNYSVIDESCTYTWTVPAGWTILSGQGSNNISTSAGDTGGTISVTPSNACGAGSAQTLDVQVCP